MTKVSTELKNIKSKLADGNVNVRNCRKDKNIAEALETVGKSSALQYILVAMGLINELPGRVLYRR